MDNKMEVDNYDDDMYDDSYEYEENPYGRCCHSSRDNYYSSGKVTDGFFSRKEEKKNENKCPETKPSCPKAKPACPKSISKPSCPKPAAKPRCPKPASKPRCPKPAPKRSCPKPASKPSCPKPAAASKPSCKRSRPKPKCPLKKRTPRSRNPFIIFFLTVYFKKPGHQRVADVAREAGKLWCRMPDSQKTTYIKLAQAERRNRMRKNGKSGGCGGKKRRARVNYNNC